MPRGGIYVIRGQQKGEIQKYWYERRPTVDARGKRMLKLLVDE